MAIFMVLCGFVTFVGVLLVLSGLYERGVNLLVGIFMILAAAIGVMFVGSRPDPVPFRYFLFSFFSPILFFLCVVALGAVIAGVLFLRMKFRRKGRIL